MSKKSTRQRISHTAYETLSLRQNFPEILLKKVDVKKWNILDKRKRNKFCECSDRRLKELIFHVLIVKIQKELLA